MNEELQSLYNEYIAAGNSETPDQFLEARTLMGEQAFTDYVNTAIAEKKKVETTGEPIAPSQITDQLSGQPINQVDPRFEETENPQVMPAENSTASDSILEQPLLDSDSTTQNNIDVTLPEISKPVVTPQQVTPVFNIPTNNITSNNNVIETLAGKQDDIVQTPIDLPSLQPDQKSTDEFLNKYSDKDYLNSNIPFVEKGVEYTAWATTPESVKESNDRLLDAERNGDVMLKNDENGELLKDENGNYKYEILTDSYKENFNKYISELNKTAGAENIDRARFNQGNLGNTPEADESVQYLNELQKEYGVLFTDEQVAQLTNAESRKQLEINLETERRLKENPALDYNTVVAQVTSEKQGLSEQQKMAIGNNYVRGFFLETPSNYLEDEQDEYRFYQNYFSDPKNIAEFGDFMNDSGKAIFDTSWIKSNQTKKEQQGRKDLFENFLVWKGKNDRLDLELNRRAYENAKSKAELYQKENNIGAYNEELSKINQYLESYDKSIQNINNKNTEFQDIQKNYSKTLKSQEEKANFQLRVQQGDKIANVENFVGNVVLGAETSVQNAVTGLLRIASIPAGQGNFSDAVDILSKPLSFGNVDIARISDKVINYKSGNDKYKEVNGTLYKVNSDGSLQRPEPGITANSLQKTSEDTEYNVSGLAFVTSKMLADIFITQKTGGAIGGGVSELSNAISNSKKIASVFGEGSQLAKTAASYARMAQNPTAVMVNGWTVQMYNDNYLAAENGGIKNPVNKHLYAFTTSYILSQIQRINPDTNFLKTINSEQQAIVNSLLEGNTQKAILGIQSLAKKASVNTSKEVVEENVQQATQDIINIGVNSVADKKLQVSDVQDYKDVFIGTVVPSLIASGLGGRVNEVEVGGRKLDLTQLTRNELVTELARTPEGINMLEDFRDKAFFDSQKKEADKIITEVKERQKYINKIPDSENYSTETINRVIPLLQEIDQKKVQLNTTEDTFKPRVEADVNNISAEVNNLLDSDNAQQVTTQSTQEPETVQEQASATTGQSQQDETPTISQTNVEPQIPSSNETAQNIENISQQAITESPIQPADQADVSLTDSQATQDQDTQIPETVQIDETLFDDNIDLTPQQLEESNKQISDAISLFESFNQSSSTQESIEQTEQNNLSLSPNQTMITDNVIANFEDITLPDGEAGIKITITDNNGNAVEDRNGDSEFEFASQEDANAFIAQKSRGYTLSRNRPTFSNQQTETASNISEGQTVNFSQFGEAKSGTISSINKGRVLIKGADGKNYVAGSPLVSNLTDASGNAIQLQLSNDSFQSISKEQFDSLIEQLKKPFKNAFKNLNVTTNLEEATQKAKELGQDINGSEFTNTNGNIYGFKLSDGTIYINPNNLNYNTPIHEFSHLWEQLLPNAWRNGLNIFKETNTGKNIYNRLKNEGNYSNLTDNEIWSEALNTYIADYAEWKNNNPKGKMKQFADWVKDIFAKIGNYFGIKSNPETSLRQFSEGVIVDLLGGKEILSESQQNNNLKIYLRDKLNIPENVLDALPKDLSITYKLLMGDPSMTINERIAETRLVAAQTRLSNVEIDPDTGSILVDGIGDIQANIISTFKYYLTGSNRINSDIVHEIIHAGTVLTMRDMDYYEKSKKYQETNKYNPEQLEALDNIKFNARYYKGLYQERRKLKPFGTSLYGLNNEYEFIAEFMSNPRFKEWILDNSNDISRRKNIQERGLLKGGVLRNIWDNIKILLGLKNKQIDTELENEINRDISIILDAQKNNIENYVDYRNNSNTDTIQFSKAGVSTIPKSTFAKIVNATSISGKESGYNELTSSDWFNSLPENITDNITVDNFQNLMLDQAKLIQENDNARIEKVRSQAEKQISKVKEKSREKIAQIIEDYKNKIQQIKADEKKSTRDKSLEQKRALRTAVKDIKSYLSANVYNGKITPAESNRLIRKASELGTRKDIIAAVNEFTKLYDEIQAKAESRLKQKEFTLDEYNEIKPIVKEAIDNNKSLSNIYEEIRRKELSNKKAGVLNEAYENQIKNIYDAINNENLTPEEAYQQMKDKQNEFTESMKDKRTREEKIKSGVRNFIKYVSDRQYLPKKLLQEIGADNTANRMVAMAGSSSRANEIFSQLDKKIFKGLKLDDKQDLNALIVAERILSIEKNRADRGLPPIQHPYANPKKALEEMKNRIGDQKYSDLQNRAKEYFKAFKDILSDMRDNGLISQDGYDSMIEIDYQPRVFIDRLLNAEGNLDEDGNFQNFSGQNGGLKSEILKKLDQGSTSAIVDNAEWLLKTALSSRYKAMAMNEVNRKFMTEEFWKAKDRFDQIDPKNFANKADEKFYNYFKELQFKIKDNPIVGVTEVGNPKYQYDSTPQGFKKAYYYVDGVRNEFFLAEDFHQEWHDVKEGLIFDPQAKGLINKWSGAALIKAMATGYNPTFAFTNTPRDFMQTLVFSPEYSNNLLIGTFQLGYDQVKAITRMFKSDFQGKEDTIFSKYIEYGGGMDFLHVQGLIDKEKKLEGAIRKVLDSNIFQVATLMKLSKWSEMMTRMAIFERAVQNQLKDLGLKSIDDVTDQNSKDDIYYSAVASARGIMDFNQGGKLTKDLDAVMPYLNAATQGTRVAVDAFRRDPLNTSIRMFQAGGIMASTAIGISYALLSVAGGDDDDKRSINQIILDSYDGLSQYQRANYINIILPSKDDKGEHKVFKIAKTQFVAPLSYIMEEGLLGVIRKVEGKPEKDFKKVLTETGWVANKNMTPIEFAKPQEFITSVATKNPLMKASLTYVTGYDFFKDEVITFDIKKNNFPRELEGYKDDNVEDFYKGVGSLTGGSPARMKAFVESIVTTPETNPFVTMIYGGADLTNALAQGDSKGEVVDEFKENIQKVFTKRLVGVTSDYNRMRREREEVQKQVEKAILEDEKIKLETDILAKKYNAGTVDEQGISNKFNEMNLKGEDLDKAYKRLEEKVNNKASDTRIYDIKYSTSNSNTAKAILIKQYFPEVYENTPEGQSIRDELKQFKIFSKDVQEELLKIKEVE